MTEKFSLSELQHIVRDSLYLALPDFYWVVAEISEIKQNYSGHCYLELIEKQSDDTNIKAKIKAVIWSSRYGFIKSFFENTTGDTLREGFKILVKAKIEYHELYGLSLVITDIDPSYTVGEMAARRIQIIRRLEQEGVFEMNKELEIPIVPQRIAVISSRNAAGYQDFMNHLRENSSGYVFYTALFDSVMQGSDTEQSIINALNRIVLNVSLFDVVVIIRGGGSQTDLSWFDNYNLAYFITQFPLPVITGIGHEKDLSVTDMVACRALKTPTAVAGFLIDCLAETENHLIEMSLEIQNFAREILDEFKERLEKSKNTIAPLTRVMISQIRKTLSDISLEILKLGKEKTYKAGLVVINQQMKLVSASSSFSSAKEYQIRTLKAELISKTGDNLNNRGNSLSSMENKLTILNPENVLKRGFTITSLNGKIVKSTENIYDGDTIDTLFSDGKISSIVNGKNNRKS
ncbi:MAG: exodeoxyribonuclease VII large subunit [Bacteroidetes bacterium]|nr:exodeoxyribonuclease VII large subunit [Bacteroidota bacterium]